MARSFLLILFVGFLSASTAIAEQYTLESGETLADSEYQTMFSVFGNKRLVLKVQFEEAEPEPVVRNASLVELLTDHLIPMAISEGFDRVSIWDSVSERSAGVGDSTSLSLNLSVGSFENYDYTLGEDWIWEQDGGPKLTLPKLDTDAWDYNEHLGLYLSGPFEQPVEDQVFLEVWMHAVGASPDESALKASELFKELSGCERDGVPVDEDSYIAKKNAIALRVHALPNMPRSILQRQPRLNLNFGHEEGVAHCYTYNASGFETWDDIYKSLSE